VLLAALAEGVAGQAPGPAEDPDRQVLQEARLPADAAGLLAYLRQRSGNDADLRQAGRLIRRLGSEDFGERQQAAKRLVAAGRGALALVRQARTDPDKEVARLARECARQIERGWDPALDLAAVRLLVRLGPEGAVPALLGHLPSVADEELEEEVWFGLDALAVRQPRSLPALEEALRDPLPARRAAAACVLGRRGNHEQRAAVRQLLTDPDPMVRLRAAQGLLGAKDKAAIPVLVALLAEPSVEVSWQAEELLHYAAGEGAPAAVVGSGTAKARAKCRKAWEEWWQGQGPKLDLAKLDQDYRRPVLLLAATGDEPGGDSFALCGCDGRPRWQVRGLEHPQAESLRLLPGNRLQVIEALLPPWAEKSRPRLTERDLDGKLLRQEELPYRRLRRLDSYTRLANGNVFLADDQTAVELSPDGHEFYRRQYDFDGVFHQPQRFSNGRVVCLADGRLKGFEFTGPKRLAEYEPASGRLLRKVGLEHDLIVGGNHKLQVRPNGHYLLAGSNVRRFQFGGQGPDRHEHERQRQAEHPRRPGQRHPGRAHA
jgi:hypothetical protein